MLRSFSNLRQDTLLSRREFGLDLQGHFGRPRTAPVRLNPDLPPKLEDIIYKCLEKDRNLRYQHASDVRTDLQRPRRDLSWSESGHAVVVEPTSGSKVTTTKWPRKRKALVAGPVIVFVVLLAVGYWSTQRPRPLRVVSYNPLTHDGQGKYGPLLTDGARIYFMEQRDAAFVLAEVSSGGGDTAVVQTPFPLGALCDISPDRSALLVTGEISAYEGGPLWIVPVPAGAPRRVGSLIALDAAWSPDPQRIAYSRGNDLYLANSNGTAPIVNAKSSCCLIAFQKSIGATAPKMTKTMA